MTNQFSYKRIGGDIIVEAYQFEDPKDGQLTRAWPHWFLELVARERIEKNITTQHWCLDRTTRINEGNFLVYWWEPDGPISIIEADDFPKLFERVTPDANRD